MNKNKMQRIIMILMSLSVGIAIGNVASKISYAKKKNKKVYAGEIICIPNPDTKEIDMYLRMSKDASGILEYDSVEFKVTIKEPDYKIQTTPYSA